MATATREVPGALSHEAPDNMKPWPNLNPRRRFIEAEIDELASSLRARGNFQPVVITPAKEGDDVEFWIAAGEKRWRAAQRADVELLCHVRELTYEEALEMAGLENLQRSGISAIEEALWYQKMMDELGLTQAEVAERTKRDASTVSNALRLLKLPREVQDLVEEGTIAATSARDFLLPWCSEPEDLQAKLWAAMIAQIQVNADFGLTMAKGWVKDTSEKLYSILSRKPEEKKPEAKAPAAPAKKKAAAPAKKEKAPKKAAPAAAVDPEEKAEAEAGSGAGQEGAEPEATDAAPPAAAEADTPEETPDAGADPNAPAEPDPDPIHIPDPADGLFAAAAAGLVGDVHHMTFVLQAAPGVADVLNLVITPKNKSGSSVGAPTQVVVGDASTIDANAADAVAKILAKLLKS